MSYSHWSTAARMCPLFIHVPNCVNVNLRLRNKPPSPELWITEGYPPINQPELVHYIEIDFLYITNYYDIYYATTVIFQLL